MARPTRGQVMVRERKRGTTYGLRFYAYGERRYVTSTATSEEEAQVELANILADVCRNLWKPPQPAPKVEVVDDPGFHRFASEWLEGRKPELKPRSVQSLEWALSGHLLPHFKDLRLDQITTAEVDSYRIAKVREREDRLVDRPLSNRSINQTIGVFARVLDQAIEHGYVKTANPARGRRRLLRADKPRRTWLELDEIRALLDTAKEHRPLIATMALGGTASGGGDRTEMGPGRSRKRSPPRRRPKTDAGRRTVDLSPDLRDELASHKAGSKRTASDDLVFTTKAGTPRDRHNVRARVLATSIQRANKNLAAAGKPPIQPGVTNHTLRRTFASLLYEQGRRRRT